MAKPKVKEQLETKEFTLFSNFKAVVDENSPEVIKLFGYANYAGDPDADGFCTYSDLVNETVDPKGIDLSIYLTNPIILLQHDRDEPIGKATKVEKRKDGLWIECDVYKDACDEQTWARIKNGILKTFSIGFRAKRWEYRDSNGKSVCHILESLIFENSVVSIPANSASTFNIVKSLEDGSLYTEKNSDSTENDNKDQKEISNTGEEIMKLKVRDMLPEDKVKEFESLGLQDELEVEKEVTISKYLELTLFKAESGMGMKMRDMVKGVCKEVVGEMMDEAAAMSAKKAAEEVEAKRVEDLAVELGVTVEEAKGFTEDEITAKRAEIEEAKKDETETVEKMKSLLDTLDKTKNELTVE